MSSLAAIALVIRRTTLLTVALFAPAIVSQTTCRKLPIAKNPRVIRAWFVAEIRKILLVDDLTSFSTRKTMFCDRLSPNGYWARNSLSE